MGDRAINTQSYPGMCHYKNKVILQAMVNMERSPRPKSFKSQSLQNYPICVNKKHVHPHLGLERRVSEV